MNYELTHRHTGEVIYTADINVSDDMTDSIKLGLAVLDAVDVDIVLRHADLSYAVLRDANLRDADLSGADLRDADLRHADLSGADLSGADLRDADLSGADLSGADLRDADLRHADLSGADLRNAVLRDAPQIKNIHQTIYAAASQPGALDMERWHCGTSHCRAGWAVTLAGGKGARLESAVGTATAAVLIYMASDPALSKIPDFYCSDREALADMKRLAESEAGEPT